MHLFNNSGERSNNHSDQIQDTTHNATDLGKTNAEMTRPDVPERVFIETEKPKPLKATEVVEPVEVCDVQTLYRYLERNLEKKGYEDALINPESFYMEEHIKSINHELNLLISKIKTYYSGYMHKIDFHLKTRSRLAMIETVEELIAHKATIEAEIKIVSEIETEAQKGAGLSQNLILTYKKGFYNGFAAITFNTVLSKRSI